MNIRQFVVLFTSVQLDCRRASELSSSSHKRPIAASTYPIKEEVVIGELNPFWDFAANNYVMTYTRRLHPAWH